MKKSLLFAAAMITAVSSASAQTVWSCEFADAAVLTATTTGSLKAYEITWGTGVTTPDQKLDKIKDGSGASVALDTPIIKWVNTVPNEETAVAAHTADEAVTAGQYMDFKVEETDVTKYLSIGNIKMDAARIGTDAVRMNVKLIGEGDAGNYESAWLITADNWSSVSEGIGSWNEEGEIGYQPSREDCSKGTSHPTDGCSHLTIPAPADMPADLYSATIRVVFYGIKNNKGFTLHNVTLNEAGTDGIASNVAAADVVASTYYTVAGQEIAAPVKGINLVKQALADGSVKTIKIIIK